MGTQGTTPIKIGLHHVAELRWPKQVLAGAGKREVKAVPLPRLPWSTAAIEVPVGASAAPGVERVTGLRKIFGYAIAPLVIVLFLVADALLIWGRFGDLTPSGSIFTVLGVIGVLLILTGLIPDAVARATGTPYVSRNQLRFPAAPREAVSQLAKLNPKATIETR